MRRQSLSGKLCAHVDRDVYKASWTEFVTEYLI